MLALLESLSQLRILVIGDLMLDHYIWGEVHRISPEAPVPVVHATRDSWTAGGAANVALNLAGLGVSTKVLGCLGDDEAGERLRSLLNDKGIAMPPAGDSAGSAPPTIVKTRVIARTQQLCRIDRELPAGHYRIDTAPEFEPQLAAALADCDAVILSDYAKGVITQSVIDRVFDHARQNEILVSVDPKPPRELVIREAGLLTPNRSEALQLAGFPEPHPGDPYPLDATCRAIHECHAPQALILTLGADGMAVSCNGEIETVLPTEAREVFDVSGAGDTVIATLTAAIAAGSTPAEAARLANAAAGIVVGKMGTVAVQRDELAARLKT